MIRWRFASSRRMTDTPSGIPALGRGQQYRRLDRGQQYRRLGLQLAASLPACS